MNDLVKSKIKWEISSITVIPGITGITGIPKLVTNAMIILNSKK